MGSHQRSSKMQKMIVSAAVILLAHTGDCFAQNNSSDTSSLQVIRKNQLCLNVAPLLVGFMGGGVNSAKLGLMYKRSTGEHVALRIGAYYFTPEDNYAPKPYYSMYVNDSTRRDYYNYYQVNEKWQLHLGWQYTFGKRKLKQFAGADVISGIAYSRNNNYAEDSHVATVLPPSTTAGSYETIVAAYDLGTRYSRTIYAGLSPFYGISYPLSKHFALSAQTGFDLSFGFSKVEQKVSGNPSGYSDHYRTMDFNVPFLVNDVSLVYHF
jgi:hypothetical protein